VHRADDAQQGHNLFLTSVSAFVLVVLAPMLVFPDDPVPFSEAFLAQFAVIAYAGTRLSVLIGRGQPMWFSTTFYAFGYVWLGLAGWAQITSGINPYHVMQQPTSQAAAAVIVLVGMVSYDTGRFFSGRRAPRRQSIVQRRPPRRLDPVRVWWLVVVSFLITPILIAVQGGVGTFLTPVNQHFGKLEAQGLYTSDSLAVGGLVTSITMVLPFVALVAMLRLGQGQPKTRRPAWWAAILGLALLNGIVSNPVSSARFWAGTVILGLILSTKWSANRFGFRTIVVALLSSLIIVFPYADHFRNSLNPTVNTSSVTEFLVNKGDYDASTQMVNAVDYRRELGGTGGRQLLGVAAFWVPRSIWIDKPGATGSLLTQFINFPEANVSSPLWAETYVDGGYPLTILLFAGLGGLAAAIDRQMALRRRWGPTDLSVFALPVLSVFSIIMLRGSMLSMMGVFLALVGTMFVATKRANAPDSRDGGTGGTAGFLRRSQARTHGR
jgi:hypothetical protein